MVKKPSGSEAEVVSVVEAVSPSYLYGGFAASYVEVFAFELFEACGEAHWISGAGPAGYGVDAAIGFFALLVLAFLFAEALVLLRVFSGIILGDMGLGLVLEAVGAGFEDGEEFL